MAAGSTGKVDRKRQKQLEKFVVKISHDGKIQSLEVFAVNELDAQRIVAANWEDCLFVTSHYRKLEAKDA